MSEHDADMPPEGLDDFVKKVFREDVEWAESSDWLSPISAETASEPLTLQAINDIVYPPITVFVAPGKAQAVRERILEDLGEQGRRRVTVEESMFVSPEVAYIFNGRIFK